MYTQFSSIFFIIFVSVSTAALPINPEKLSLLNEQGYEVISGAEEFLTPVSPDQDNGINLSDSSKISKPDMLLYGKYYVLRKKALRLRKTQKTHSFRADDFLTSSARDEAASQILDRFLLDVRQAESKSKHYKNREDSEDAIIFPDDNAGTTKKYVRARKSNVFNEAQAIKSTVSVSHVETGTSSTGNVDITGTDKENVDFQVDSSSLEKMSSDEFVEWAKDNLSLQQISDLLHGEISELAEDQKEDTDKELSDGETTTDEPEATTIAIGYNSFILVPSAKCPEGTVRDHRDRCSQVRKINPLNKDSGSRLKFIKSRSGRGNARRKLEELVSTLKALEEEAVDALKSEVTAITAEKSSTPTSTTTKVGYSPSIKTEATTSTTTAKAKTDSPVTFGS